MATYYVSSAGSNTAPYDTWAKAATALQTAVTASAAGDTILIGSNHTEVLTAATMYLFKSGVNLVSTNTSTSEYESGAVIDFTGTAAAAQLRITMTNATDILVGVFGVKLKIGNASYTHSTRINGNYHNCIFERTYSSIIYLDNYCRFHGCSFVNAAGVTNALEGSNNDISAEFYNCSLFPTGGVPSSYIIGNAAGYVNFVGCDLSTMTATDSGASDGSYRRFVNCKLHPSHTFAQLGYNSCNKVTYESCSSGDHNYDFVEITNPGIVQDHQTIYLTGGAQLKDVSGTLTNYSLECNPSTKVGISNPLHSPLISTPVSSTGNKTAIFKIAYDSATALKDTECWIEVEYYGDANTPMTTVAISAPTISGTNSRNILAAGTSLPDTSEAWTGTSGWTNKKTATISKTVSVQQQGFMRVRLAVAKDVTVYLNPIIL